MSGGTRGAFDQKLIEIRDNIIRMGQLLDSAIERSMTSLKKQDQTLARQIISDDTVINNLRFTVEEECLAVIATQQPMASDLRVIVAAMNLVNDMERMGDHATGIAKTVLRMGHEPLLKPLIDLPRMAERARDMLRRTLDALVLLDVDAARAIAEEDDEVDALYDQVYRELLTYMINDPQSIDRATWLLWVGHNLERIADRVTNICERIIFRATGELVEINVSTY